RASGTVIDNASRRGGHGSLQTAGCTTVQVPPPSLYFDRSRDHRDPPSFPTRRSSDLIELGRDAQLSNVQAVAKALGLRLELVERSEEHTSELQSRGHIVCRLLLGKKQDSS